MENTSVVETSQSNTYHFCPACGEIMGQEEMLGIMYWVCPECGYTVPVNPI